MRDWDGAIIVGDGAAGSNGSNGSDSALTGILELKVPDEAEVIINDKKTKLTGPYRRFRLAEMESGQSVTYKVRVEVVPAPPEGPPSPDAAPPAGKKGKTKFLTVSAGQVTMATFDFSRDTPASDQVGSLVLNVPADATVELGGAPTSLSGSKRVYNSSALKPGQKWEDYEVKVTFANGEEAIKSVTLVGGEPTELTFEEPDPAESATADNEVSYDYDCLDPSEYGYLQGEPTPAASLPVMLE